MNTMVLLGALVIATGEEPTVDQTALEPMPAPQTSSDDGDATGWLHHLQSYGVDYAALALVLAADLTLLPMWNSGPAIYGPRFDDRDPDLTLLNSPARRDQLDAAFREDSVPVAWLYVGGTVLAAGALTHDLIRHPSWHRAHNLLLGGAETILTTWTLTEVLKRGVGRLRPDFIDRANLHYCDPEVGQRGLAGLDCSRSTGRTATVDAAELEKGHRSFPSGHASTSFALATYFALYIGGETVWGHEAEPGTVAPGMAAMAGLVGLAATVAATRVSDGRHHPDDVVAGAALGATSSVLFYFLHFDLDGRATRRGFSVAPLAWADGAALTVAWAL